MLEKVLRERNSPVLLMVMCIVTATMGNTMEIFQNVNIEIPYGPAILLLCVYLKKIKTLIWKDTWTPVFISALFTIAKIRKEPKYPSTDE